MTFSFFLHPVQVTVNETSKHQEAGLMWEIPSPTVFFLFVCLFWPLSLVWGGNAYHFTCLLSEVICERGRAPCMSTSNKYIQGRNPWYREMVFSTPKHSKGELVKFYISK